MISTYPQLFRLTFDEERYFSVWMDHCFVQNLLRMISPIFHRHTLLFNLTLLRHQSSFGILQLQNKKEKDVQMQREWLFPGIRLASRTNTMFAMKLIVLVVVLIDIVQSDLDLNWSSIESVVVEESVSPEFGSNSSLETQSRCPERCLCFESTVRCTLLDWEESDEFENIPKSAEILWDFVFVFSFFVEFALNCCSVLHSYVVTEAWSSLLGKVMMMMMKVVK